MKHKKGMALILASIVAVMTVSPAMACLGARPLGMGGAFIAVADDANATYWNPAALTFIEDQQITGMLASGINYNTYLAWVGRGWGLSLVTTDLAAGYEDGTYNYYLEDSSTWLQGSFGFKLTDDLAVGANLRQISGSRDILAYSYTDYWGTDWYEYYRTDSGKGYGLDISALYKATDKLSLGLLIQDAISSPIDFPLTPSGYNYDYKYGINVRPGVAYKVAPDTTLAMDIYGLNDDPRVCAGVEHKVNEVLTVRGGYYRQEVFTAGAGLTMDSLELDYTYFGGAHIFSGTIKF